MKRLLKYLLATAIVLLPIPATAWTAQTVSIDALRGTLTLPDGTGPTPAVLILAGSGPVDRDGNFPGAPNNSLKLLARGLAERGILSLRIDKRGIAASRAAAKREEDLRFDTYVDDAVAWLAFLSRQDRVSRILLLGHSEGALVATLTAQKSKPSALILVAGASEPAAQIIKRQLAAAGVPQTLQQTSESIANSLLKGQAVPDVPAGLAPLYRPSVQNYLMSWLPIDPAKELSSIDCPILIIQGTTDLQIAVTDAQRLAAAKPGSQLRLIEGMNHVMKDAPTERAPNLATYAMPERPLAPKLLPTIADFIARQ
jgi:pimeloyl-ACP methyl ester carboxylesterase